MNTLQISGINFQDATIALDDNNNLSVDIDIAGASFAIKSETISTFIDSVKENSVREDFMKIIYLTAEGDTLATYYGYMQVGSIKTNNKEHFVFTLIKPSIDAQLDIIYKKICDNASDTLESYQILTASNASLYESVASIIVSDLSKGE